MEKGAWLSYDKFNVILEYIVTDEKSFNELFNIADIIWETDQNLETLWGAKKTLKAKNCF